MKIRLYLDEDAMRDALLQALLARGADVTSVREQGRTGFTDEQQLEYAAAEGRVLYSFNVKDYAVLHSRFLQEGHSHAGIILAEQRSYSIGEQMRSLVRLVGSLSAEEMKDRVEFLSAWG